MLTTEINSYKMKELFTETDRHYISLLQENINRMAANSASCKTWLVTLVAAILALQLTSNELRSVLWIAVGLIFLFYFLDSYYLGIESKFIDIEKTYVQAVKYNKKDELNRNLYSFNIKEVKGKYAITCSALLSPSTWPFYSVLLLIVLAVCLWPCFVN